MSDSTEPTSSLPQPEPAPDKTIPLEPEAPRPKTAPVPVARPAAARPSILELVDDKCPNCGAKLEPEAVVCMACGYDLKANRMLKPEMGVDVVAPPPEKPEFVKPGGKPMIIAVIAGCVAIGAMAAAAANAPKPGFGVGLAVVLLVLYRTVLHTGTGLAGLWCATKFVNERFTRVDLAAARMCLAVAIFWLVVSLHIPIDRTLENLIKWPAAAVIYWVAIFALFRRSRQESLIIALFHFGAAMFVELGVQLAAWLDAAVSLAKGP